jgi:hypothetical protein
MQLTVEALQETGDRLLDMFKEDPGSVRAFGESNLDTLEKHQRSAITAAFSLLVTLASQLEGDFVVQTSKRVVGQSGNLGDGYHVYKGRREIGAVFDRAETGPTKLVLGITLVLTELGASIYEMDCPQHSGEAAKALAKHGVVINLGK